MSTLDDQLAIITDTHQSEVKRMEAVRALAKTPNARAVKPLVTTLETASHWIALEIIRTLGYIGDEKAREPLEKLLQDKQWSKLHPNIIEALGRLRSVETFNTLVKQLSSHNSDSRWYASEALGRLVMQDATLFERLVDMLFDKKRTSSFARHLLHTFNVLDDPRIVHVLGRVLYEGQQRLPPRSDFTDRKKAYNYSEKQSKEEQVRVEAAVNLGDLGDARAVPSLIYAATNELESHEVRWTAMRALAKLKHPDAVEPLIALLQRQYAAKNVEASLIETLGDLGDARAVDILVDVMRMPVTVGRYPYERVLYAAEALRKLGDARAFEGFVLAIEAPKDNSGFFYSTRQRAAEGLGELGNVAAIPYLIKAFEQTEFLDIRYKAAGALANLGDHRGVELLLAWLRNEFPESHIASYEAPKALGNVRGDQRVSDVLYDIIRDDLDNTDAMHTNAATSLARLGDVRAVEYWLRRLDARVKLGEPSLMMTPHHRSGQRYYNMRTLEALIMFDDARILPALEAAHAALENGSKPHLSEALEAAIAKIRSR